MNLFKDVIFGGLFGAAIALEPGCDGCEPHCGRPLIELQGIKVDMTEDQVRAHAYRDNAFSGCTGSKPYRRERWKPQSVVIKEGSDLFWVQFDNEGEPRTKEMIPEEDRVENAFFAKMGYQYPTSPITCRAMVFPDGEHCAYVYFNTQNKVEAIYYGGT